MLFLTDVGHGCYEKRQKYTRRQSSYMPPWNYTVLGRRRFRGRKETAALISQNRRIVSDIGKHTKSSARQRFFSFPRCGGRCFLIDLPQA